MVPGRLEKVTFGEPEFASNIARSVLPGTEEPPPPPDVVDQFELLVHTPLPPVTQ